MGRAEDHPPTHTPPPPRATLGEVGARCPRQLGRTSANCLHPAGSRGVWIPRGRSRAPQAQCTCAGWGRRDPDPVPRPGLGTAPGAAESYGAHKAQLGAPTRGVPLAEPPSRAFKCAPTLTLVHCHSHGNSYTNSTHIRAHTQFYKHASTRAHTQTRTRVHLPSQIYPCTRS